jgi:hypothetical protein
MGPHRHRTPAHLIPALFVVCMALALIDLTMLLRGAA